MGIFPMILFANSKYLTAAGQHPNSLGPEPSQAKPIDRKTKREWERETKREREHAVYWALIMS